MCAFVRAFVRAHECQNIYDSGRRREFHRHREDGSIERPGRTRCTGIVPGSQIHLSLSENLSRVSVRRPPPPPPDKRNAPHGPPVCRKPRERITGSGYLCGDGARLRQCAETRRTHIRQPPHHRIIVVSVIVAGDSSFCLRTRILFRASSRHISLFKTREHQAIFRRSNALRNEKSRAKSCRRLWPTWRAAYVAHARARRQPGRVARRAYRDPLQSAERAREHDFRSTCISASIPFILCEYMCVDAHVRAFEIERGKSLTLLAGRKMTSCYARLSNNPSIAQRRSRWMGTRMDFGGRVYLPTTTTRAGRNQSARNANIYAPLAHRRTRMHMHSRTHCCIEYDKRQTRACGRDGAGGWCTIYEVTLTSNI